MKTFASLIIFLTLSLTTNAQWFWQNPLPQGNSLNSLQCVSFSDVNNGVAVGDGGTILKTTNGGKYWSDISIGGKNSFYGVSFSDPLNGSVVGLFNNGRYEQSQNLRTTNGGITWSQQSGGGIQIPLYSVCFTDANNGTIVTSAGYGPYGYGIILRTTNGGISWQQLSGSFNYLFAVSFSDINNGAAVGYQGTILRTTNGGSSWFSQSSGTMHSLHGISLTDYNNATAVGDSGTILRTTNGGTAWDSQLSGTAVSLLSVFFSDANNGTAVGGYLGYNSVSLILRTSDGGNTWLKQSNPSTSSLRSVWFTDANNGTAVGDYGTLLRTTNGGVTFIGKDNNITNPNEFILSQNYPNPFNPNTTINYSLPKQSNVKIKVYNILGKEILTLVNENKPQGNYSVEFNANNLSSGVYFYILSTGQFTQVKKMILIK